MTKVVGIGLTFIGLLCSAYFGLWAYAGERIPSVYEPRYVDMPEGALAESFQSSELARMLKTEEMKRQATSQEFRRWAEALAFAVYMLAGVVLIQASFILWTLRARSRS